MRQNNEKYIYLSYAMGSCDLVRQVADELRKEGYRFALDVMSNDKNINSSGQEIKECEVFMCFLTKEYGRSRTCLREFRLAAEKHDKPIIPVFIGNQMEIEASMPEGMLFLIADSNAFSLKGKEDLPGFMDKVKNTRLLDPCKTSYNPSPDSKKTKNFWIYATAGLLLAGIVALQGFLPEKEATLIISSVEESYQAENDNLESREDLLKRLQDIKIGDIVCIGNYEQDGDAGNGKEEIEWIVLDWQEEKALLLSKYALDDKLYHEEEVEITWEDCSLRSWLNNDFYATAFSDAEKELIIDNTVKFEMNPEYATKKGSDTFDKVFLLSIQEGYKYFENDEDRICQASEYAQKRLWEAYESWGLSYFMDPADRTCCWWLRSPGRNDSHAAYVYFDGSIDGFGIFGISVGNDFMGVRPAILICLE